MPWAIVEDARLALALLAAAFYRHPSGEMRVVGITGTNGKTTTAYLLASIFEAAGIRCGMLGTVAYRIGDEVREATRTTPEAPDVQALLREMVDRRLRRLRDGSVVARAVAAARRRHHVRRRRVHQPDARPPRLPRRHGRLLPAKRRLFEMLPRDAPSLINLDDPRGAALRRGAAAGR